MIVLCRLDPLGVRSTLPSTSRVQRHCQVPSKSRPYPISRRSAKVPLQKRPQMDRVLEAVQETKTCPILNKGLMLSGLPLLFFAAPASAAMTSSSPLFQSPELQGVVSALLLILFSEIGDKTFFVALLLALQNSKTVVFTGTYGALSVMTLISVGLGQALHQVSELIPQRVAQFPFDDILAIILLIWFGIQTLQTAQDAEVMASTEQEEAEEGLRSLDVGSRGLILSTFLLVFSAEWGDKSFLATTALSAVSSPLGVTLGALTGHCIATSLAVLGGSFLSRYVSEKSVQYIGGALFLIFALEKADELYVHLTT